MTIAAYPAQMVKHKKTTPPPARQHESLLMLDSHLLVSIVSKLCCRDLGGLARVARRLRAAVDTAAQLMYAALPQLRRDQIPPRIGDTWLRLLHEAELLAQPLVFTRFSGLTGAPELPEHCARLVRLHTVEISVDRVSSLLSYSPTLAGVLHQVQALGGGPAYATSEGGSLLSSNGNSDDRVAICGKPVMRAGRFFAEFEIVSTQSDLP